MNNVFNIPAHTKCTNCGACCGIIPASDAEVREIRNYIAKHGIKPRKPGITCPFRNEKERRCDIYPVRPMICRLYGVADMGHMGCPNGNSAAIDGSKFIDHEGINVLNFLDW